MAVYQCKSCQRCYGHDARIPQLKPIDWKTHTRYTDSDTWRCPHCNMHQDSRDLQPFLGCGGNGMLKELTEDEIQTIIDPQRVMPPIMLGDDMWYVMRERFRI